MRMNFRYTIGVFLSLPFLPLMYFQGKRISNSVPKIPEATGNEGKCILDKKEKVKPLEIISIGESTIAGVGVKTHKEGFTGILCNEISRLFNRDVNWKVYAKSGYTAKMVTEKLIPKITERNVDLIIIGLGGNDAFTLNRPSKWNLQINSLIRSLRIKFPNAYVVFCNMPPIKEFPAFTKLIKFTVGNLVEILGNELKGIVNSHKSVYYLEEKITLKGWSSKFDQKLEQKDFFSDGVHPSKLTYQIWAMETANKIYEIKEIKNAL